MSRTKRFRKDKYLIQENRILEELVYDSNYWFKSEWVKLDPQSLEAKKQLARFHSDAKVGVMRWRGPSWFQREYAQCPYRNLSKRLIKKYMTGEIEDIVLYSKPKRKCYW